MRCTILLYRGNFVDLGFYDAQAAVDARHWIFPGELVRESMLRIEESRCCGSTSRPAAEFSLQ